MLMRVLNHYRYKRAKNIPAAATPPTMYKVYFGHSARQPSRDRPPRPALLSPRVVRMACVLDKGSRLPAQRVRI